jgi:ArsR family transcriptional regulator, arsenate/arsenite/antimonite-responsive transcriptional repressor
MEQVQMTKYEARAEIIKAMAHPTRLLLVELLSKKERCVGEMTEAAGVDTSTVSKHLSVLRNAGIVSDEKRGLQVYYKLKCPCVLGFLSCVEKVLEIKAREQMALVG